MGGVFLLLLSAQFIMVASLTDTCGGSIELDTASYLTSPGYPLSYPPSQHCKWVITARNPSQKILLQFNPFFQLDKDEEDEDCKYDYVEVYNGGDELSPSMGKFCGKVAPPSIISKGNQILIKFVSDNETNMFGFAVNYEVFQPDTCGGSIELDTASYLTSPGYPLSYPPSQHCKWVITARNPSQKILLQFNPFFQLDKDEEDEDCKYDYVEVYNGGDELSPSMGKFCGKVAPSSIISKGNQILIKFVSDNETNMFGFAVNYKVFQPDTCGGSIELDTANYLTSPGYPLSYPPSQHCKWVITARNPSQKILLQFNPFFQLDKDEEDEDCKYDYVEVYNGGDELSPSMGKFCGKVAPPSIISKGNQILIKFVSDNETNMFGFAVNYEVFQPDTCGGSIELDTASYLTSPGYPLSYPPFQHCKWVITARNPSQKILLQFNPFFQLDKDEEDEDCKYDYVEVYNGGDELSPSMGKFCGKVAPPSFISKGNQILIKFVSDNENNMFGFAVIYKVFQPVEECSRNFSAPQDVITSPGFPKKYPNNLNCTFTIFTSSTSKIVLDFTSFDLEQNHRVEEESTCNDDRLDIWDGLPGVGTYIGRYCGQTSPGRVVSHSGILSMIFITDNTIAREGFSANYTIQEKLL